MTRIEKNLPMSLALGILISISIWAAVPGEPFNFLFVSDGNITHDGQPMYADGDEGVHAQFPPTGNIVLDPDRNAKGKNATKRFISLIFPEDDLYVPGVHHGFSLSINGAKAIVDGVVDGTIQCDGSSGGPSPRNLTELACIRASVVVHEVFEDDGTETPYRLRCNDEIDGEFGHIRVECTTSGASELGSCTNWRVFAADDGGSPSLKCALYHFQGKGRNATLVRVDENVDYDMAFEALVDLQ